MNVKDIRRKNMRILAESIGGITPMAELLAKSQSQISHLIGKKPIKNIGDKIAAQVEIVFNKPHGWLDREHDNVQELGQGYLSGVNINFHCAPLISWQRAAIWPNESIEQPTETSIQLIPSTIPLGKQAFALRVTGDSMEAPSGISFSEGAIIIVDPDHIARNKSFVLIRLGDAEQVDFKQLVIDGHRRFLKPLNPRYPLTEILGAAVIIGTVRLMLMEFH